jgi:hypothetical protein
MYFQIDVDPYEANYAHLLERIQIAMQTTFAEEHALRSLMQADIARDLSIDQSVVSRRLNGGGNVTLRSISDFYTAMGREPLENFRPLQRARRSIAAASTTNPQNTVIDIRRPVRQQGTIISNPCFTGRAA